MFVNRKRILVEFADCDPANIAFFANYFRWFDDCTTALFLAAGLPIRELFRSHGVVGIPVVDAKARFIAPSSQGDEFEVESAVIKWGKSSFVVAHKFFRGNELTMEGQETRVWAAAHLTESGRLKAVPLPKGVVEKLSGNRTEKKSSGKSGARR